MGTGYGVHVSQVNDDGSATGSAPSANGTSATPAKAKSLDSADAS